MVRNGKVRLVESMLGLARQAGRVEVGPALVSHGKAGFGTAGRAWQGEFRRVMFWRG